MITNVVQTVEQPEYPYIAGGNIKWCNHFGKQFGSLKMLDIELPYSSAITFLGIHQEK